MYYCYFIDTLLVVMTCNKILKKYLEKLKLLIFGLQIPKSQFGIFNYQISTSVSVLRTLL